jgi:hypothetical protein
MWVIKASPTKLAHGFLQIPAKAMQFCTKLLAEIIEPYHAQPSQIQLFPSSTPRT